MKRMVLFICLITALAAQGQFRNAVVIDEIMVDPSPPVRATGGLPEAEFIELKNTSGQAANLNGWTISDPSTIATIRTGFVLQPDSFVILCSNAYLARFLSFGAAVGITNFPSLDNEGGQLTLRSKDGMVVHSVSYHKSWYGNEVKSEGGWSLEMIDPQNACSGAGNWQASKHPSGGTPGTLNSVNASNKDLMPPTLLNAFAPDPYHITVTFNESLDSVQASLPANYLINENIGSALAALPIGPMYTQVRLTLRNPLTNDKIYTVSAKGARDCSGNETSSAGNARVTLTAEANPLDIVINEIFFNPPPEGTDYIEIYNRSKKTINLRQLLIANRTLSGVISSVKQLCTDNQLLFPGDYLVVTENSAFVKKQFNPKNPESIIEIKGMPSYPDDRGVVILMNGQGTVLDELAYDQKWHFKLIDNNEGVALERIDYDKPTQDEKNWHSAATSAGYGTPTSRNSQYKADELSDAVLTVKPDIFSPDNDGVDDFATLYYQFPEPGYLCNITIFDAGGRPVKFLTRNALCGLKGYFRWDGLDEKNNPLAMGVYVCITEVFNLKGITKKFKQAVALARKF